MTCKLLAFEYFKQYIKDTLGKVLVNKQGRVVVTDDTKNLEKGFSFFILFKMFIGL